MSYKIVLSDQAEEDLKVWKRSGQLKALKKIRSLLAELEQHPYDGTGQIEPLKDNRQGQWSRRIDKYNRIIYTVHDDVVEVHVISLMGHY